MKNSALVILAAIAMVAATESFLTEQAADKQATRYEAQAERYEKLLDVQEQKYMDEIIDLKQKLHGKTFELDMATNHIELLNADH